MSGEPLRILQILRAPVGGLFKHVSDLTRELSRRGHAVGIVADSLSGDAQTEAKLTTIAESAKLGVYRLPMPRLLGARDLTTPLRIKRLAKRLNVSVLHGHGAKGGFGARLAAFGSASAAIYTPHGGALHFDAKSGAGRIFMTIERGLLRATNALIFESAYAQRTFATQVAETTCRQCVIHNGLTSDEYLPVTPTDSAADFVFVGELRKLKGVDLLVKALAPLHRPDGSPATLVMAGDGPERARLEERIAELGLFDRITLVGMQPARLAFARGRCVVVPSRTESLPYVVLEAAAAGRPIIATSVGGVPEIFGPTSERLLPPNDVSALRVAMAHALTAPDQMLAEARIRFDFIEPRFSVERMADGIEALYRRVLQ